MRIVVGVRAGIVAAGLTLLACATAGTAFAAEPLEPDLSPEPASDLSISFDGGIRSELRMTTALRNTGSGPLELYPVAGADCNEDGDLTNDRIAYQRVFDDGDDDGVFDPAIDTASASYEAGCMIFHPAHNHWHFDDFSDFELLTPGGKLVAATEKVSFCLVDTSPFDALLPGAPAAAHYSVCLADSTEGISVGWRDIYFFNLPGQAIDIEGVPDGDYCVAVNADPDNLLRESDDSNNVALRGIAIQGATVTDSAHGCTPADQPAGPAPVPPRVKKKRRCRPPKGRGRKRARHCRKKRRKTPRFVSRAAEGTFFCPLLRESGSASRGPSAAGAA